MDKNLLHLVLSDILKHFGSLLENPTLEELVGETVLYQKTIQSKRTETALETLYHVDDK